MLKTPWSLQQCSSSPISLRRGSAESVVLPVPERPKNSDTSPASPSFAEQCMESTPRLGHQVVHHREDALFHFAGVFGAQDDEFASLQADIDAGAGGHLVRVRIGGKLAGVVDHVVGLAEIGRFFRRGTDQHVVHEQRVVRPGADDADLDAIARVPAGETIDDVKLLASVQIIDGALAVDDEYLLVELDVHRPPPNAVATIGVIDDAFIHRAAAGFFAGADDQRAAVGDGGVLQDDRVFIERRGGRVADGELGVDFVTR